MYDMVNLICSKIGFLCTGLPMSRRWRTTWRIVIGTLMVLPLVIVLPVWAASHAWKGGFVYELDGGECLVINEGQVLSIGKEAVNWVDRNAIIVGQVSNRKPLRDSSIDYFVITNGRRPPAFADVATQIVAESKCDVIVPWFVKDVPKTGIRAYSLLALLLAVSIMPSWMLISRCTRDIKRIGWMARMKCLSCGYPKIGLTGVVCPECGQSLVSPTWARRLTLFIAPLSTIGVIVALVLIPSTILRKEPSNGPNVFWSSFPPIPAQLMQLFSRPASSNSNVPFKVAPILPSEPGDFPFPKTNWRDRFLHPDQRRLTPPDIIGPGMPTDADLGRG